DGPAPVSPDPTAELVGIVLRRTIPADPGRLRTGLPAGPVLVAAVAASAGADPAGHPLVRDPAGRAGAVLAGLERQPLGGAAGVRGAGVAGPDGLATVRPAGLADAVLAGRGAAPPAGTRGGSRRIPLHRYPGLGYRRHDAQCLRHGGAAGIPLRAADRR